MAVFKYKDKILHCDKVSLVALAEMFGTPLYVCSAAQLQVNIDKVQKVFNELNPLICFAVKANDNLVLLRLFHKLGLGFDIVSGGEFHRVKRAGANPKDIVFAGAAKIDAELEQAVQGGCGWISVESTDELIVLEKTTSELDQHQKVLLRLNPDITPDTHHHIVTGSAESKFGIPLGLAKNLIHQNWSPLNLCGIHPHIGSQIHDPNTTLEALEVALNFLSNCSPKWDTLDLGGGFPVSYHPNEHVIDVDKFATLIIERLANFPRSLKIIIQLGRSIVADAAVLLVSVQTVKQTGAHSTATVDSGMNTLFRPGLYDAYHQVLPLLQSSNNTIKNLTRVAGPICESSDYLARD